MGQEQNDFFSALYLAHSSQILNFAFRYTGEKEKAADIMQKTFLTALLKSQVLQKHPKPLAWLYKTAWHIIQRELPKQQREVSLEAAAHYPAPAPPENLAHFLPKNLPPQDIQLLRMYYEEQRSVEEIASTLGISTSACKMRLFRVRGEIKSFWEKEKKM